MDAELYACHDRNRDTVHGSECVPLLKPMKRFHSDETEAMADVLRKDGTLAVPTDTVYGVCAGMSEAAMKKLYEVKHRPASKRFPIMCSDEAMLETIAEMEEETRRVIHALMPGPLTIVLRKKDTVPAYASGDLETIAVRLATSEPLRKLIEALGTPIFLTSANRSGEKECETLDEIEQACPLLDGMMEGSVSFGQASTILDCSTADWRILREGPISREQIEHVRKGTRND